MPAKQSNTSNLIEIKCAHCGIMFADFPSNRRKFCSHACYSAHLIVPPEFRPCEICAAVFKVDPRHKNQRCCSPLCGATLSGIKKKLPFQVRFWRHVDENGPVPSHRPELGNCWIWIGGQEGKHSIFHVNGRNIGAHRASWIINKGPIPDGMNVCHKCDNPPCVRPNHLFLGDDADNQHDCIEKGRKAHGEQVGNSILTDQIVREIRTLRMNGITEVSVAAKFGVDTSTVNAVVHRRNWKHVE